MLKKFKYKTINPTTTYKSISGEMIKNKTFNTATLANTPIKIENDTASNTYNNVLTTKDETLLVSNEYGHTFFKKFIVHFLYYSLLTNYY